MALWPLRKTEEGILGTLNLVIELSRGSRGGRASGQRKGTLGEHSSRPASSSAERRTRRGSCARASPSRSRCSVVDRPRVVLVDVAVLVDVVLRDVVPVLVEAILLALVLVEEEMMVVVDGAPVHGSG